MICSTGEITGFTVFLKETILHLLVSSVFQLCVFKAVSSVVALFGFSFLSFEILRLMLTAFDESWISLSSPAQQGSGF